MDLTNRMTMVNSGVRVVVDVMGTLNLGNAAKAMASAMPISMRYPSQRYPWAEQKPTKRQDHLRRGAHDSVAERAGRSGSGLGVLGSRSSALAGPIMAWPWSPSRMFVSRIQTFKQRGLALRDVCLAGNKLLPASTRG